MEDIGADTLSMILWGGLGLIVGLLIAVAGLSTFRFAVRRHPIVGKKIRRCLRNPTLAFFGLAGLGSGLLYATSSAVAKNPPSWRGSLVHWFSVIIFLAFAYFLTGVVRATALGILARVAKIHKDESSAYQRRVHTQVTMIARVVISTIWLLAIASALFTFKEFRVVGTSLLASAGLASIIAGLAAQSTLKNFFAGLHLAFTDAVRVGDYVVVDEDDGVIDEINLSYVVLKKSDESRVIIPSHYLAGMPFENLTRESPEVKGFVQFDVDWLTPIDEMRAATIAVIKKHPLWDGRSAGLKVLHATGTRLNVRASMTSDSPDDLGDLQDDVRESMVKWLQDHATGVPKKRIEEVTPSSTPDDEPHGEDKAGSDSASDEEDQPAKPEAKESEATKSKTTRSGSTGN